MTAQLSILQTAWSALGEDPAALEGVRPGGAPGLPRNYWIIRFWMRAHRDPTSG